MPTPEERIVELGLVLPPRFQPTASYVTCRRSGADLHLAGHGPVRDGKIVYRGKVGVDLDIEEGQASAALTVLNILSTVKAELGTLSRVRGFVRLSVFVNSTPEFTSHHVVADGASTLLNKIFGPMAAHARSAIGVPSLPLGMATEIEALLEVD